MPFTSDIDRRQCDQSNLQGYFLEVSALCFSPNVSNCRASVPPKWGEHFRLRRAPVFQCAREALLWANKSEMSQLWGKLLYPKPSITFSNHFLFQNPQFSRILLKMYFVQQRNTKDLLRVKVLLFTPFPTIDTAGILIKGRTTSEQGNLLDLLWVI